MVQTEYGRNAVPMRALAHKINVNLFIDLIVLHMNSYVTFVTIYGPIPHRDFVVINWGEMQVFDETQELIKTKKDAVK